ncbi:MAG TPA: SAM-dependent methyltransferase, partial [Anaerolineales bacterium]
MDTPPFIPLLAKALDARRGIFDPAWRAAFRLFNGFTEGFPALSADLYGATLVLYDYSDHHEQGEEFVRQAVDFLQNHALLSGGLRAILVKTRNGLSQ